MVLRLLKPGLRQAQPPDTSKLENRIIHDFCLFNFDF